MRPTRIYVKALKRLTREIRVKGISNITGGGFYENIPRMLPAGVTARIENGLLVQCSRSFRMLGQQGGIPERDHLQYLQHGYRHS